LIDEQEELRQYPDMKYQQEKVNSEFKRVLFDESMFKTKN